MTRAFILLSLVALAPGLVVPPVAAGTAEPPTHAGHPFSVALAGLDPGDPAALPLAMRDALARAAELPGGMPLAASPEGLDSHADRSYVGRGAGDLDGDGLADALVFDDSNVLTAYRALDGKLLWDTLHQDPTFVLAAPDLNGDGRDDLVVVELTSSASPACVVAQPCEQVHRWDVRAISGADGNRFWTRSFPGVTVAAPYWPAPGTLLVNRTSALVVPQLAGDVEGDGLPDLVLNVFHVAQTYVSPLFPTSVRSIASGVDAFVLQGSSGAAWYERSRSTSPGFAFLAPMGEAVGGAGPDFLWVDAHEEPRVCFGGCSGGARRLDLEAIDGPRRALIWSTTTPDGSFALATQQDLDADGSADILEYAAHGYLARSGADGSALWSQRRGGCPLGYGDLGGEDGQDVLLVRTGGNRTGAWVVVDRVDGATGNLLGNSTRTFAARPDLRVHVLTLPVGDQDRDGVTDLAHHALHERGISVVERVATEVKVESGADGSLFHELDVADGAEVSAGSDFRGDGGVDLLVHRWNKSAASVSAVLTPGGLAWTHAAAWAGGTASATASLTGDQDGDGREDLVLTRTATRHGGTYSRVDAVSGRTGDLRPLTGFVPPF